MFNQSNRSQEPDNPASPFDLDPEQWLESLEEADRSHYEMMAIEVWSIAKTMEVLLPGFWNRFMCNRQVALKEYLKQKQAAAAAETHTSSSES